MADTVIAHPFKDVPVGPPVKRPVPHVVVGRVVYGAGFTACLVHLVDGTQGDPPGWDGDVAAHRSYHRRNASEAVRPITLPIP